MYFDRQVYILQDIQYRAAVVKVSLGKIENSKLLVMWHGSLAISVRMYV